MTPEEMDRKIEFIIESQSRLAAAQEQDRYDRIQAETRAAKLQEIWSNLAVHQSERMDNLDRLHRDWLRENRTFQQESRTFHQESRTFHEESRAFYVESRMFYQESRIFHQEVLALLRDVRRLLNLILDKLPPGASNPN
jgi:hypothetical protein